MIPPWPEGESHTHPDAPMDHWLTTLTVQRRPAYGRQAGQHPQHLGDRKRPNALVSPMKSRGRIGFTCGSCRSGPPGLVNIVDAPFLAGLTECRRGNGCVRRLGVTAKLNPEAPFLMEAKQNLCEIRGEKEAAGSDVLLAPVPIQRRSRECSDERNVLITQLALALLDWCPSVKRVNERGSDSREGTCGVGHDFTLLMPSKVGPWEPTDIATVIYRVTSVIGPAATSSGHCQCTVHLTFT